MKYWNKDKSIRQRCWHCVEVTSNGSIWVSYYDLKRELQLIDSPGRFYMYFASRNVWFERVEDAVWFRLKYA